MAEYTLSAATLPANTGYPGNLQALLQLIQSYISVTSDSTLTTLVVSDSTPQSEDNDKIWFQTQSGYPQTIKIYSNGFWKEFTPFSFGDLVLTDVNAEISSPWGVGSTTYVVDGISTLTPATPVPPTNAKYKVYVGSYG